MHRAQFRYALLSLAALEVPLQLELNGSLYGQDCVFIANDWHASLVPVYLAGENPGTQQPLAEHLRPAPPPCTRVRRRLVCSSSTSARAFPCLERQRVRGELRARGSGLLALELLLHVSSSWAVAHARLGFAVGCHV